MYALHVLGSKYKSQHFMLMGLVLRPPKHCQDTALIVPAAAYSQALAFYHLAWLAEVNIAGSGPSVFWALLWSPLHSNIKSGKEEEEGEKVEDETFRNTHYLK